MNNSSNLKLLISPFIITLLFLYITNTTHASGQCNTTQCEKSFVTIEFPFYLKNTQPESCGIPGFELQCNKSTTIFNLPIAGNFTVNDINYHSREIKLSDPNNCLPKKLLSLDLNNITKTPFRPPEESLQFTLYNCTGDRFPLNYVIDCLSGSGYTVVSGNSGIFINVTDYSNCTYARNVTLPSSLGKVFSDLQLRYASGFTLTWDKQRCNNKSCSKYHSITFFNFFRNFFFFFW